MSRPVLLTLLLLLLPATAAAAVPTTIGWQGVVSDGGNLLQGAHDLTFRLYTTASGGTALWTETQTLTLVDGVGEAVLGSVQSLGAVDFAQALWLGVAVDGGAELEPRTELTAVPYALAVDDGAAVTALNGLSGPVNLQAGTNVSLDASGNTITINSIGGGGSDGDWNISGDDLSLGVPGNVGLGRSNPTHKLDMLTPYNVPVSIRMRAGGSWSFIMEQSPESVFTLTNGDQRKFSMDPAGRIGIGTEAPQALLHLDSPYLAEEILLGQDDGAGYFENRSLGVRLSPQKLEWYYDINVGGKRAAPFTAGIYADPAAGNFGIDGFSTWNGGLNVNGTLRADGYTEIDSANDVDLRLRNAGALVWTVRNDVSQGNDFQILRSSTGTPALDIDHGNGTWTVGGSIVPSTVSWTLGTSGNRWGVVYAMAVDTPSDRRLKKEIRDLDQGLDEVLALRPVSYLWKEHPEKGTQVGLIAQELREVIPEVVHQADDEQGSLSVEYMALLPVLVKALQEQQALIETQREDLAVQAAGLRDLDARLKALETGGESGARPVSAGSFVTAEVD